MEMPNYYAIIPANIRYDKDLPANAKLLYGEITALCNKNGFCWATNEHFANLYCVSKTTISLLIKKLIDKGYIKSQIIYKEGSKEILNRYLSIVNTPIEENLNTPIEENLKDNNTSINNTSLIKENIKESENKSTPKKENEDDIDEYNFKIFWDEYPRKEGRTKAFGYFKQWVRGRKINGKTIKLTDMQIYDAVRAYAKEKKYTETKYIQQGSTFFNTTILDYVDME